MLYVSEHSGAADIYQCRDEPGKLEPADRLTEHPAGDYWPRADERGRRVLFVSTREDAGGDIYLRKERIFRGPQLVRLTDESTMDDQPAWHPAGDRYYCAAATDTRERRQVFTAEVGGPSEQLTQDGGQMPDCSPDGRFLVYVVSSGNGSTHLRIMRLGDRAHAALTSGRFLDLHPRWAAEGDTVLFARVGFDTTGDGRLDGRDASSIYSMRFSPALFEGAPPEAERQLTSFGTSEAYPAPMEGGFLFTRFGRDSSDVYAFGESGEMPDLERLSAYVAFARRIDADEAANAWRRQLAWQNVAWAASSPRQVDGDVSAPRALAEAWLGIGRALLDVGRAVEARRAFERVVDDYAAERLQSGQARLQLLRLDRLGPGFDAAAHISRARELEAEFMAAASRAAGSHAAALHRVAALARLEIGRAQLQAGRYADALAKFNEVAEHPENPQTAAQALLGTADVHRRLGGPDGLEAMRNTYLRLLSTYPDALPWSARAAEKVLDTIVAMDAGAERKLADLRDLVERYSDTPILPALAQNYVGDVFYEQRDFLRAVEEYRRTIARFPSAHRQAAAAMLAIGRIRMEQQDYERAVAIFSELADRAAPTEMWLRERARRGYANALLRRAQRARRLGDLPLALDVYSRLVDYDDDLAGAHRGLVQSYNELGRVGESILAYRPRVDSDPRDHVAHYALALAYSYYGPSDWVGHRGKAHERSSIDREALRLVESAILVEANVPHYHQLRGFLLSRLALATGDDEYLTLALDAYLAALGLSGPAADPANYANLLFNVGEAHRLVNQSDAGWPYYQRALNAGFELSGERGRAAAMDMGRSALAAGEYRAAETVLGKGLQLVEELGDGDARALSLRAHMLDLLGLTRHLAGEYAAAASHYRQYAEALQELVEEREAEADAYRRNLVRARRNLAVNLYMAWEQGSLDRASLPEAYSLLEQALKELQRVGVVGRRELPRLGLVTINVDVALGQRKESEVLDIAGEKRLLHTYMARICAAGGDYKTAAKHLRQKLALYPELPEDTERTDLLTEVAVVETQLAEYLLETGYLSEAAASYARAASLESAAGNETGWAQSIVSWGRVLLVQAQEGRIAPEATASALAAHRSALTEAGEASAALSEKLRAALAANMARLVRAREGS